MPMDNNAVIATLNDLIETCKDGEQGFNSCAENVKNPELKAVFVTGARRCAEGARELQAEVQALGGKAETSGSFAGTMHRRWVDIKSAITGKDDKAVISECERGEDVAKGSYQKALNSDLPANIRGVVKRQYEGVLQNHDKIRSLERAATKAAS